VYAAAQVALGFRLRRAVRDASDFFVAGRSLGPGLIFSTMLAANIGAGSTVGATGIGYTHGVSAWWWVGSAAVGSTVLAFWIGPAMRRVAAAHSLRTVGDYLEHRFDRSVRGVISSLLWIGSVAILSGQLIAIGTILEVVAGLPFVAGCAIGAGVITVYFAAGGLLTSAWMNVVQLTVKLAGFALAVPLALGDAGGWSRVARVATADPSYWTFWRGSAPGVMYLALLGPAFVVSPGLLQKIFGARDDRAVRVGVGLNALGLFLYAAVPALLGMIARAQFPALGDEKLALPTILMHGLPPVVGAIGLAAVFSAEVSAADAVLFMLTTSFSQDLYKRFVNPAADDRRVLTVARLATLVSGALGVVLALFYADLVETLKIFYALLGVSLFVPIIAGLYVSSATSDAALGAIIGGVGGMLVVQGATGGEGYGLLGPAPAGLLTAAVGWTVTLLFAKNDK
jgi:SSS family solute:Na+ symporter